MELQENEIINSTNSMFYNESIKVDRRKIAVIVLLSVIIMLFALRFFRTESFGKIDINQTLIETKRKPSAGSPNNYTPWDNVKIAAGVLADATYFEAKTTGTVKAMGTTQTLTSTRVKFNNSLYTNSVSVGSSDSIISVKTAQERYIQNLKTPSIYMSIGKISSENNEVSWGDINNIETTKYFNDYGLLPVGLSKYKMNSKNTKVTKLKSDSNSYTYKVVLDPKTSVDSYAREVASTAGAKTIPKFESIELRITIDSNWNPLKVEVDETYEILMYGIPARVKGKMVEVIENINKKNEPNKNAQRYIDFIEKNKKDK
ncbi:hypothetical protein BN85412150 [Alteracholeplasma palmae J233]|uniref:Uncharacterized protein n=1 Tax=Alteracholeplasma palmae (strain ATCC 49389 / J233) TaxID=1318466 RepID=U4KLN1_ALTPJ|nr:hypothetical protein [Alteracholeplasma palmae]CCV64792.1 hypothetical protein BN85412150 [Alteracholeplasma palmae J233]